MEIERVLNRYFVGFLILASIAKIVYTFSRIYTLEEAGEKNA